MMVQADQLNVSRSMSGCLSAVSEWKGEMRFDDGVFGDGLHGGM
jgi:hypothetical protein